MADLNDIQKAIDERRIDSRSLNSAQREALDVSFKSGELKGYEGVDQYEQLIDTAALSVAQGKMQRLKPLEASTGIDRGEMILAGTLGFGMLPYLKEKDALVDSFVNYGFKNYYGIDTRAAVASDIYAKRLGGMSDFAKKMKRVPGVLGTPVRVFGNLIGMLDDSVDFFKKVQKFGPSPALAVETKAGLAGYVGAGAGSLSFEVANLGSDFVGATSKDMANLTDNQIRKMPFVERAFVNAVDAAYTEMLWTTGALGLVPLVRGVKGQLKSSLDLDKAQAKEIAAAAERTGQKLNIVDLIPVNTPGLKGAWQAFVKKFFTTLGVYPLVNAPLNDFNKAFNANLTQEQFFKVQDNLELAPKVNLSILNYTGVNQIKNEFKNVWKVIDDEYGRFRDYYEKIGNPRFIPMTNIRATTNEMISRMKTEYPEQMDIWTSLEKGARDLTPADDSLVAYIKYLNSLSDPNTYVNSGEAGFSRLSDMLGLSRMMTQAYSRSSFKVLDNEIIKLKKGFENDINSLGEATNRGVLKDKIFKDEYAQKLANEGPESAEAFIDANIQAATGGLKQLQEANAFYSMVLRPYEKSSVARKLLAADRQLFASKGIDMTGIESIAPDQVFDKVIRGVLSGDSPIAIKQLKQILGVTDSSYEVLGKDGRVERIVKIPNSKESQAVWDRYVSQWYWDSWNNATTNPIRDLRGLSAQAIAERAKEQGFIRKAFNPLDAEVEQRVRAKTKTDEVLNLTEVDARIFTQGGGIANVNEGLIRNHDFGALDIDEFVKNLGIDNTQGKDKIREIFGGGAKGQKALSLLEDVIAVKRAVDSTPTTDPSKFIQRSLTLRAGSGGGGGMTTTAVTGAVLGMGNTLKLILASRGFAEIIASPKLMEHVMDLNKWYRFALDKSEQSIFPGKGRIPLNPKMYQNATRNYIRVLNSFFEAQGDNFRVDPDKIDFEEIRQKINSLDPNVSLNTSFDFGSLPKFTRDRIYPEYEASKILNKNPVTRQAAEEFFTGASIMGASHNQFEKAINSNPLMQATEPQVNTPPIQPMGMPTEGRDQMQMTTPQTPQDTGQRASTYQALFPQDALGTAIAARSQQFNEGGLVQDAYAHADEVLNG